MSNTTATVSQAAPAADTAPHTNDNIFATVATASPTSVDDTWNLYLKKLCEMIFQITRLLNIMILVNLAERGPIDPENICKMLRQFYAAIQPLVEAVEREDGLKIHSLEELQAWAVDPNSFASQNAKLLANLFDNLFKALKISFTENQKQCSICDITHKKRCCVLFKGYGNGRMTISIEVSELLQDIYQPIFDALKMFHSILELLPRYQALRPENIVGNIQFLVKRSNGSIDSGWEFAVVDGKIPMEQICSGIIIQCQKNDRNPAYNIAKKVLINDLIPVGT
jgi:hypothetical protein